MYIIPNLDSYILYLFKDGAFRLAKTFDTKDDLLRYIVKAQSNYHFLWNPRPYNDILENLNVTGNDVRCIDDEFYLRHYLITDQRGRYIDPRIWADEIEALKAQPQKWHNPRKYTHIYRQTPVAYTGSRRRRWDALRTVKHYHRSLKQDSIPEYQPYVRHKARVEDPWISEPWEHTERSWKRHRKHQWKD